MKVNKNNIIIECVPFPVHLTLSFISSLEICIENSQCLGLDNEKPYVILWLFLFSIFFTETDIDTDTDTDSLSILIKFMTTHYFTY